MKTRTLLMGVAVILLAAQARGDTADEVERSVRAIQAAFDKGETDTLRGLMTEDHLSIMTYARFADAAELLKALADYKIAETKLSEIKVKALTKDVALASYGATIKGTYKGSEGPLSVLVTGVWVKRNGKWLEASYQETPVPKK